MRKKSINRPGAVQLALARHGTHEDSTRAALPPGYPYPARMRMREYEALKNGLQIELLKVQKWVKDTGQRTVTLFVATSMGIPVSTTHTITGAIVGVGLSRRVSAVRWGVAGRILWAWVLTIPVSAIIAAIFWSLARGFMS